MDAVSYAHSAKQAQRIEKFIENPDSNSGIVTVPKVIATGETVTIPEGRVAVLPNVQVDGVLNIEGEVFVPSGATFGDLETQLALKAPLSSPAFTDNPTAPTQTAGDDSTKLATTAYVDGKMVLGTVVNAAGTSIDFIGIPSWAKNITLMFNGVSTNGSSPLLIQIGDSGGIENSGYNSVGISLGGGAAGGYSTIGFLLGESNNSSNLHGGKIDLCLLGNNIWTQFGGVSRGSSGTSVMGSGSKTLSGNLDRVRITTGNGTDTFDAGSINIMYEG